MSRKKSILRLAPGANSAGASIGEPPEHLAQRVADGRRAVAELARCPTLRWQVALEVGELLQVLLERKSRSSWPRKPSSAPFSAPVLAERLPEQVEARR